MMELSKPLICVCGPTASGKSGLAVEIAAACNAEIISVDSVQVYEGFDIGSAKPTLEERKGIPHHLIDVFLPNQRCDAARFSELADQAITDIRGRNKLCILVGGSNLYLKALLHGLADLPAGDETWRESIEVFSTAELYAKLQSLDSAAAARIHENDRLRIIRSLETAELGDQTQSETQQLHAFQSERYSAILILLEWDRDELNHRIGLRVNQMLEAGLMDEVRELVGKWGTEVPALSTVGYRQIVDYLNGDLAEMNLFDEIAQNTRRLGKMQRTFWRNEPAKRGWKLIANGQICSWNFNDLLQFLANEEGLAPEPGISLLRVDGQKLISKN